MLKFKEFLKMVPIWLLFLVIQNVYCGSTGGSEASTTAKPSGWYSKIQCPSGTFIKAIRLGVARRQGLTAGKGRMRVEIDPVGYSDERGLENLEVYCSAGDQVDKNRAKSEYTLDDHYSSLTCPGNTYATGYGLFYTKDKFSNGRPKSNVWYLGPHAFVNSSTSSLHLFCGQSYGIKGADFYFGTTPKPDVVHDCPATARGVQDKVICQLEPRKWQTNNRDAESLEWNLDEKCCFADPLVCYGTTDYPVIQICSNTDPDSTTDLTCEYTHTADLRNDGGPSFFGFMEDDSNAANFSSIDRWSNGNLNYTLARSHTVFVDGFGARENFRTELQPEVRSPSDHPHPNIKIISRKLSFKVKPGTIGRVRQLRGSCGGTAYSIYASIYEISFWDREGNRLKS